MKKRLKPTFGYGLVAIAGAALVGGAIWIAPVPANALPKYSAATKLRCGRCHLNPSGGGPLTALGKSFKANGHKLPKKETK